MNSKTLKFNIINSDFEKKLFYFFSVFFLFLLVFYIYIVSNITFNIIERKDIRNEIGLVNSNIGNLELEYLSLSNQIDLELVSSLGFKDSNNTYFVSRKTLLGSVSYVNNGI